MRFWNSDVTGNFNAVIEQIYVELYGSREAEIAPLKHRRHLRKLHPTPPLRGDPPPPGEGKKKPAS